MNPSRNWCRTSFFHSTVTESFNQLLLAFCGHRVLVLFCIAWSLTPPLLECFSSLVHLPNSQPFLLVSSLVQCQVEVSAVEGKEDRERQGGQVGAVFGDDLSEEVTPGQRSQCIKGAASSEGTGTMCMAA